MKPQSDPHSRSSHARALSFMVSCMLSTLFPDRCPGCGAFIWNYSTAWSAFFCQECASMVRRVESPLCSCCGAVFEADTGVDHLCGECLKTRPAFYMARSFAAYERPVSDAVKGFKYKGEVRYAILLASFLNQAYERWWPDFCHDMIVPVPLHPKRLRLRGFNPACLVLEPWGRLNPGIMSKVRGDLIVRIRNTPPQAGLSREERRRNLERAFSVRKPGVVAGKNILLIDDVMTTGATAQACAMELLKEGAARVDLLTMARA